MPDARMLKLKTACSATFIEVHDLCHSKILDLIQNRVGLSIGGLKGGLERVNAV